MIAGLLAHSKAWAAIEERWITTESAYGIGKFHWRDLRKTGARCERCNQIELDLLQENLAHTFVSREGIVHVGACMNVSDYDFFSAKIPGVKAAAKTPHDFCQEHVYQQVITWSQELFPGENLVVMMDRPRSDLAFRARTRNDAYQTKDTFWGKGVSSITFGSREDYAPLRVADFVANQTFKHFRDVVVNKNPEKTSILTRAMERHRFPSVARFYDIESLVKLAPMMLEEKTISEIPKPEDT